MTSNVILFRAVPISDSKNFVIENIEQYLYEQDFDYLEFEDFQYIRHSLDLSIKVNLSEEKVEPFLTNNFNYAVITNIDDNEALLKKFYYFIVNRKQVAQHTVQLDLRMDVLNTFKFGVDYQLNKKTNVLREHKDRWEKKSIVHNWTTLFEDEDNNLDWVASDEFEIRFVGDETDPVSAEDYDKYVNHADRIIVSQIYDEDESEILDPAEYSVGETSADVEVGHYYEVYVDITLLNEDRIGHSLRVTVELQYDDSAISCQRIIDFYSEGISVPLYKDEESILNTAENVDWYLIYKNRTDATLDDPQPIDCYLAPSDSLEIYYTSEPVINYSGLTSGFYYVFSTAYNSFNYDLTFSFEGGSFSTSWNGNTTNPHYYVVVIEQDSVHAGKVKISKYLYAYSDFTHSWSHSLVASKDDLAQVIVSGFPEEYINLYRSASLPTGIYEGDNNHQFDFSDDTVLLSSFESVDRTDVLLNKIIALPYAPFNVNIDENGRLITPEEWEYDAGSGLLKLRNINSKLRAHISSSIPNAVKEIYEYITLNPDIDEERNNMFESKLFHSDYYQFKFVYDSYSFVFRMETINPTVYGEAGNFEFDFFMTSSMNSRFLFSFNWLELYYSSEDFDKILPVARNNEVVIFSSAYLNYLRTSYNYDVKAKERTINSAYLGLGLNIVGQGANVALSTSNPALAVKAGIGAVSSVVSSLVNTINTVASAEDNFNKNIALLKAQSVSVMGSDDLDIMQEYCNNKAKVIHYACSNKIEDLLFDLFYYTGYKTEETKVPVVNTRYWFNFLQCEAVFENGEKTIGTPPRVQGLRGLTAEVLDELTIKFAEGVTFFHAHQIGADYFWNVEQTKENWEVSLL